METRHKSRRPDVSLLLGKKRVQQTQCKIKCSKKSTKQFDFFYHRSCFRTMDEFYKSKYHEFYSSFVSKSIPDLDKKQGTGSITKLQMNKILEHFINELFGGQILNSLTKDQRLKVVQSMLAFVYAHRHNKDDVFILESKKDKYIDFSIVRDVMYCYSKKA
jgi:hypothetical protein